MAVVRVSSPLPPVPSSAADMVAPAAVAPVVVAPASAPISVSAVPPATVASATPPLPASVQAAAALRAAAPPVTLAKPVDPEPSAAIPLTREKVTSNPPSAARSSRPRIPALRRRAGEDLIGELFETMHELHFVQGIADGAEFMLAALDSVVPCEAVLIHVYDINTQNFVVVRAKGPGSMQVLMHRTSDSDPFLQSLMRRPGSVAFQDVEKDPRVLGPRWDALGIKPARVLCGPVRQGGRYLGLLEIANPLGDAPFHQTEQNAVDYVCEQFAEFLANRPLVLEADVILKR
jgi:hypothetical protein